MITRKVFVIASRGESVYNRDRMNRMTRRFGDLKRLRRRYRAALAILTLCACAALGGCRPTDADPAPAVAQVEIDGAAWDGAPVEPGGGLRVYIALDGAALVDVPFGRPRTVGILQPDGARNTVEITSDAVFMREANCDNQDCVDMGEVTRDNLETRVLGGFIICLPHRLSVEVREGE